MYRYIEVVFYMNINLILQIVTLILLVTWWLYWRIHEKEAAIKKPKTDNKPRIIEQIIKNVAAGYLLINLLGFIIFPFDNLLLQIVGFVLVFLGFIEGIIARKTLKNNWTDSHEFQIKKNHELITKGIYGYVRHPIYGGILLVVPGVLLVSTSWTFIVSILVLLFFLNSYAKREEKLLTKHFGKKYIEYKKMTKKFIPFIY